MKLLTAGLMIIGMYAAPAQAAWLCDPNVGGAGCMQCSDSFCDYGSQGTGYLCFHSISGGVLDTSVEAVSKVNEEAKSLAEHPHADIKKMAESLVNLTVKEAKAMGNGKRK